MQDNKNRHVRRRSSAPPAVQEEGSVRAAPVSPPLRVWHAVLRFIHGLVPVRGDPILEILRKSVFYVALVVLVGSLSYIANEMLIIPADAETVATDLRDKYDPENPPEPPPFPGEYPDGIQAHFKWFYAMNQDIRGWIKYKDAKESWLNIDYPVMWTGDNNYYLSHNFNRGYNRFGTPFFDMNNRFDSPAVAASNKVLIVYGHRTDSGGMFSQLNEMLTREDKVKSAPLIQLDTLYEQGQYKVFAVMLCNTTLNEGEQEIFNYLRTVFYGGDADFMDYVANVRARSIWDYPVDVRETDQLLILSTCTTERGVGFKDGRCVVVARRLRDGEDAAVDTAGIRKNSDVIMPEAWYTHKKQELHPYYSGGFTIPNDWKSGTTPGTVTTDPVTPQSSDTPQETKDTPASGTQTKTPPAPSDTTKPAPSDTTPSSTGPPTQETEPAGSQDTQPQETEPSDSQETQPHETEPDTSGGQ